MKKKIFIFLLLLFTFTLTGCFEKGPDNNNPNHDKQETDYIVSEINGFKDYRIDSNQKIIEIMVKENIPFFTLDNIVIDNGEAIGFFNDSLLNESLPPEIKIETENNFFVGIRDFKTSKVEAWQIHIMNKTMPVFYKVVEVKAYFTVPLEFNEDPTLNDIIKIIDNITVFLNDGSQKNISYDEFVNDFKGYIIIESYNSKICISCNNIETNYFYKIKINYNDLDIILKDDLYFNEEPNTEDFLAFIDKITFTTNGNLKEYRRSDDIRNLINENGEITITENKIKVKLFEMVKEFTYTLPTPSTSINVMKPREIKFAQTPTIEDVKIKLPYVTIINPDGSQDSFKNKEYDTKGIKIEVNEAKKQIIFTYEKYNLKQTLEYQIDPSYVRGHIEIEYAKDSNDNKMYFVCDSTPKFMDILPNLDSMTIFLEGNRKKVLKNQENILKSYNDGDLDFDVDPKTKEVIFSYNRDVTPLKQKYIDLSDEDFSLGYVDLKFMDEKNLSNDTLISFSEINMDEMCKLITQITFQTDTDSRNYVITNEQLIKTFINKFGKIEKINTDGYKSTYNLSVHNVNYGFSYLVIREDLIKSYKFNYNYDVLSRELYEHIPSSDQFEFLTKSIDFTLNDGSIITILVKDYPLLKESIQNIYHKDNPGNYFVINNLLVDITKYDSTSNLILAEKDEITNNRLDFKLSNPCFLLETFDFNKDIQSRMQDVVYSYTYKDGTNYAIYLDLDMAKRTLRINQQNFNLGKNNVSFDLFRFTFDYELIMYKKGEEKNVYKLDYLNSADGTFHITKNNPTMEELLSYINNVTLYYYDGTVETIDSNELINEKDKYNINYEFNTIIKDGYQDNFINANISGYDQVFSFHTILKSQLKDVKYESYSLNTTVYIDSKDPKFRITYDNYLDYLTKDSNYTRTFTFVDPLSTASRAYGKEVFTGDELKALLKDVVEVSVSSSNDRRLDIRYSFEVFSNEFNVDYIITFDTPFEIVEPRLEVNAETNEDGKVVFQYKTTRSGLSALVNYITYVDKYNVKHIYKTEEARQMVKDSVRVYVYFAKDYVAVNLHDGNDVITCTLDYIMNPTPEFIPTSFDFTTGGIMINSLYTYNENITLDICKDLLKKLYLEDASGYYKLYGEDEKNKFIDKYCRALKIDNEWYLICNYPGLTKNNYKLPIVNLDNPNYNIDKVYLQTEYYPKHIFDKLTEKEVLATILNKFLYSSSGGSDYGYFNSKSMYDLFSIEKNSNSFKVLYNGKPITMKSYHDNRIINEIKFIDNNYDEINFMTKFDENSIIIEDITKDNDILNYINDGKIGYLIKSLPAHDSSSYGDTFDLIMPSDILSKYGTVSFNDSKKPYTKNFYTLNIFGYEFKNKYVEFHNRVDNDKIQRISTYGGSPVILEDLNNIDYGKLFNGYIKFYNGTVENIRWVSSNDNFATGKEWVTKYSPKFEEIEVTQNSSNEYLFKHKVKITVGEYTGTVTLDLYHVSSDTKLKFVDINLGKSPLNLTDFKYDKGFKITKDNIFDLMDSDVDMEVWYNLPNNYSGIKIVNAKAWLQANTTVKITETNYKDVSTNYLIEFIGPNNETIYSYDYDVWNLIK